MLSVMDYLGHIRGQLLRARGTTQRSMSRPMGDDKVESVKIGNAMVARVCLLILLAHSVGVFWVLEQPRGSLLENHPCFQLLMRKLVIWRKHIRMCDYGSETEKGTWLYSGPTVVKAVYKYFGYTNTPSQQRVCGIKGFGHYTHETELIIWLKSHPSCLPHPCLQDTKRSRTSMSLLRLPVSCHRRQVYNWWTSTWTAREFNV